MNQRILQGGAGVSVHYKGASVDQQTTIGASGRSGISSDSLGTYPDSFFSSTYAKNPVSRDKDTRIHFSAHSVSTFSAGRNQTVSAGIRLNESRYDLATADEWKHEGTCTVCENDSPVTVNWTYAPTEDAVRFFGAEAGLFAGHEYTAGALQSSIGIRADYFQLLDDIAISPRISEMISLGDAGGSLLGGAGRYNQFPTDLPTIVFNYLSSTTPLPADSMRRTAADGEPAMQPQDGKRRAYGIEVSLCNARRSWLSYSGAVSLFDVKNRFGNARWYNDWTNVGYTFSLSGGATVLNDHTFSVLLQGSGGRPFCPELVQSDCIGRKSAAVHRECAVWFCQENQQDRM
jgi:hypothetical protein